MLRVGRITLLLVLLAACGLPLAWLAGQLITRPTLWGEAVPDSFRLGLIARTFGYNALAASLATLIALPVGLALGFRARGAAWLWWLVPVPLLVPSLVITYGWKQALALASLDPLPQSALDVARCIVALASWLWPVPAMAIAFAACRLDASLLLHARLDGAARRIVARLLLAPALLGWLAAMLLALQEFAVFEPTGNSVIATEVRFVFETGASLDQSWSMLPVGDADAPGPTQDQRMAAALTVMLPGLLAMLAFVLLTWRAARSLETAGDWSDVGPSVRVRVPLVVRVAAIGVTLLALGVPLVAMIASRRTAFRPLVILDEYQPQLLGSATLALLTAGVGTLIVTLASLGRPSRAMLGLAVASFLVGGQWAAIALIVVFNRPWLVTLYDSAALPVLAYVGRFAWVGLFAAAATWSPGVRPLRDLASTDGAGPLATWRWVVLPLAWPLLAGGLLLIFTLSLTEVPATTLLQPAGTIVPMLMTWAHILNYDAMIDASLMLAAIVMGVGVIVVGLCRWATMRMRSE